MLGAICSDVYGLSIYSIRKKSPPGRVKNIIMKKVFKTICCFTEKIFIKKVENFYKQKGKRIELNEEIFIENMGKVIKYNNEHKAKSFKWTINTYQVYYNIYYETKQLPSFQTGVTIQD